MFSKFCIQQKIQELAIRAKAVQAPILQQAAAAASASQAVASINRRLPGNFWLKRCDAHTKLHKRREEQEIQAKLVRPRHEVFMDLTARKSCGGDMRLNKLNWWLNNLGQFRNVLFASVPEQSTEAILILMN